MGLELIQQQCCVLSQKQELGQRILLSQRMDLQIYLEITEFFRGLYENAKKGRYEKHGLCFEYATIRKRDLPKKMLVWGPGFAIFDYNSESNRIDGNPMRFVVIDYLDAFPREYRDIVAVHEYGESLAIGHKESSILEWGVAKREGILSRYLQWIDENFPCKLADLSQCSMLYKMMPEEVCAAAKELSACSEETRNVLEIMKGFDFPHEAMAAAEHYRMMAAGVKERITIAAGEAQRIVFHEPLEYASFFAAYEFHKAASTTISLKLDRLVSTCEDVEDHWSRLLGLINEDYMKRANEQSRLLAAEGINSRKDQERGRRLIDDASFYEIPLQSRMPIGFAFALEVAKLLSEKENETGKRFEGKLKKAARLAAGSLNVAEPSEYEELRPGSYEVTRFYIKTQLFEAVSCVLESEKAASKGKAAKFAREVAKMENEFMNRAGKGLFSNPEAGLWRDFHAIAGIVRMNKSNVKEKYPVAKLGAEFHGQITAAKPKPGRLAFAGG